MILVPAARIAELRAKGWWGSRTLADLFDGQVRRRPDAEACVDPVNRTDIDGGAVRRLSWRALDDEVNRLMAVLHARGIRKDDVVIVQLANTVELGAAYLACLKLGIVVSPAPVQYRENELDYIAGKTEAVAAITATQIRKHDHAAMLVKLRERHPHLKTVFTIGAPAAGAVSLTEAVQAVGVAQLDAAKQAATAAAIDADDVFTVCWTSGTEAQPKGVPRSHNEWIIMGEAVIAAALLTPGMRILNPFPMVNMAGISSSFVTWLLLGAALVQHHPFDLQVFLRQLRDEKIEYSVAPPAVLNLLLQNEALVAGIDFTRLKTIGSGSAPLTEWMVRTFHERYGVAIVNYFGSNEGASFAGTISDVPDPAQRAVFFPRLGRPEFRWDFPLADRIFSRLVDPETEQEITEPGKPGEMRMKGATVFSGYWRADDVTARAFDRDGWFRTGDMFEIGGDRNQYYRFVGRLKDIVIRGGMNISPEELENHLIAHPRVADVAIIGFPDPVLGEKLCACVVAKPGEPPTLDDINRFLTAEKHVAVFKQVERLVIVPALPRNPVGKILKRDLRQQYATV
jgi:acyl-CoA synthetase (AMP-forming)/AMP-acid ligase II